MRIVLRIDGTSGVLTGDYFYEARGVRLALRGSVSASGGIVLDETNAQGLRTGRFEGRHTRTGALVGTWSSPDAKRRLPFSVTRMARSLTTDPAVITKRVIRRRVAATEPAPGESKPGMCEVDVKYAEISGVANTIAAKINERLAPPLPSPAM